MGMAGGDVAGLEDVAGELGDGSEFTVADEDLLFDVRVVRDRFEREVVESGDEHGGERL